MPMRRSTPLPTTSSSELPYWLTRTGNFADTLTPQLSALFRHAARCALGSTLAYALVGCGQVHLPGSNRPVVEVAGTGGSAGNVAGSGAGGIGGVAGTSVGGIGGVGGFGVAGFGVGGQGVDAGSPDAWQTVACGVDGSFDLSTIQLATPADFFAARQSVSGQPSFERTHVGTACATALDAAACRTRLQQLSDQVAPDLADDAGTVMTREFLVVTRGDTIRVAVTPQQQLALLGSIDSGQEAALLVSYSNVGLFTDALCGDQVETRAVEGGFEVSFTVAPRCGTQHHVVISVTKSGVVSVLSDIATGQGTNCGTGRRPEGLLSAVDSATQHSVGALLADMAHLEAASVYAFENIVRELLHYGAPETLRVQAERAIADEIVHTELTRELSRRFGREPQVPKVAPQALRDLEAFALDNAVEGCVRETYGAALATYQAQAAHDAELRAAFETIACDETRHASLSWQIAQWVTPQLDPAARARVQAAQAEAVLELAHSLGSEPDEPLQTQVGLPSARVALQLMSTLNASLWGVPSCAV